MTLFPGPKGVTVSGYICISDHGEALNYRTAASFVDGFNTPSVELVVFSLLHFSKSVKTYEAPLRKGCSLA